MGRHSEIGVTHREQGVNVALVQIRWEYSNLKRRQIQQRHLTKMISIYQSTLDATQINEVAHLFDWLIH